VKQHRGTPIHESISWTWPETSYTHVCRKLSPCPVMAGRQLSALRPAHLDTLASGSWAVRTLHHGTTPHLGPCIIHHRSFSVAQRRTFSRSFGMRFDSRIRAAIDGGLDVHLLAQVRSFIIPHERGHVGSAKEEVRSGSSTCS